MCINANYAPTIRYVVYAMYDATSIAPSKRVMVLFPPNTPTMYISNDEASNT